LGSIAEMLISEETRVILTFANIGLIIFVIWFVARIYFNFKSKSETHSETIKEHSEKIESLEKENNTIKINQAVVETKLDNIEVGIVDIKVMLTTHINK
jgi:hypothetical protein